MRYVSLLVLVMLSGVSPTNAFGEQGAQASVVQQDQSSEQSGHVAQSSVGEIGQRQKPEEALGIKPLARIDSRIANRVESRIRSRIDRDYSPQASGEAPFAAAENQTRSAGRPR